MRELFEHILIKTHENILNDIIRQSNGLVKKDTQKIVEYAATNFSVAYNMYGTFDSQLTEYAHLIYLGFLGHTIATICACGYNVQICTSVLLKVYDGMEIDLNRHQVEEFFRQLLDERR
jgi:hypothetical protein